MKKLVSVLVCACVILSLVLTVNAVDDSAKFIEYAPQYNYVGRFDTGVAVVKAETEYTLIDTNNKVLAQINGEALGYSDHVTRIYRDGKVFFRNDVGVEFFNIPGIYAKAIAGGKTAVQNDSFLYGLYNDKGEMLLPHEYSNILYGTDSHILLQIGSTWKEYDLSVNNIVKEYGKVVSAFDESAICLFENKYGVINYEGEILIPFVFDKIGVSGDTFIAYSSNTTSCFDSNGSILFSGIGGICGAYSEGLYYNNIGDCYAYRSADGNTVIDIANISDIQYGEPFSDGYAVVHFADKKTYIDSSGTLVTDQMWDGAYRFSNGYALVYNQLVDVDSENYYNQWCIINENFDVVKTLDCEVYVDSTYPTSTDFSDGYIRTIDRDSGLMGFIRLDKFDFDDMSESYAVSGTITSSDSNPTSTADDTVTIILSNADNTYTVTVDSTGVNNTVEYRIEGVVSGTYTMTVSKKDHVNQEYTVIVESEDVTQDVKICLLGDVTGDGAIKLADYMKVKQHAQNVNLLKGYALACADVTGDRNVKLADYMKIKQHAQNVNLLW